MPMDQALPSKPSTAADMAALSSAELIGLVRSQAQTIETLTQQLSALTHQLEWFKRQMFGTRSERLRVLENEKQLALGEILTPPETPAPRKERVVAGAHAADGLDGIEVAVGGHRAGPAAQAVFTACDTERFSYKHFS